MITSLQIRLATNRFGRSVLHVWCIVRGGKLAWHLTGIRRELFSRTLAFLLLPALLGTKLCSSDAVAAESGARDHSADYYAESFRPQFHFTPEKNWMNDPNGMVF